MPAGTSLGEGIGLQEPRRDDRWMMQLAKDNAARDAAEAKRKADEEKELVKETDINIDVKNYLPVYAKKVNEIVRGMYNDLAAARQGGKTLPSSVIRQKVAETKMRLNDYLIGNEAAKAYINDKTIMQDADVLNRLQSTDATLEELEGLTSTHPFIRVDRNGGFSAFRVPNKPFEYNYGDPDAARVEPLTKMGRTTYRKAILDYSPESVDKAAEAISADPNWAMQTLFRLQQEDRQKYGKMPNETQAQFFERMTPVLTEKAFEDAQRLKPPPKITIDEELALAPSGSGSTQKVRPAIVQETGGIMADVPMFDTKGEELDEMTQTQVMSYDMMVNVPDAKAVTIPVTAEIKKLNPILNSDKYKNVKSINVDPNNIYRGRGAKGYELVATGTTLIEIDGGDGQKIQKSFTPVVPYNLVKGSVEAAYKGFMDDIYKEMEIGQKPTKSGGTKQSQMTPAEWSKKWSALKSGESLVGLDGKTYTKK